MPEIMRADVTSDVISIADLIALVSDQSCGAVVSFTGDVRNIDKGRDVSSLRYEIHPMAADEIVKISQRVIAGSGALKVAVSHRFGEIAIGETAFAVAVSSTHRDAAFEICSLLVNEIKEKLPIWKHQIFKDGSDEWVNTA